MKRKAVQGWTAFFIFVILLTEKQNGVIVLLTRKQKTVGGENVNVQIQIT